MKKIKKRTLSYDKYMVGIVLLFLAIIACTNIFIVNTEEKQVSLYKVDLNRTKTAIESYEREKGEPLSDIDTLKAYSDYDFNYIVSLHSVDKNGNDIMYHAFFDEKDFTGDIQYIVYTTAYAFYRIDYKKTEGQNKKMLVYMNLAFLLCLVLSLAFMLYIRSNIIKPFHAMSDIPYELSKGNLAIPLKENKNRYFGKFTWGMDLLRENLEHGKKREQELIREKKLLLMSLSHDIKTPLSAIKLYSNALCRDLYREEKKKKEIAVAINEKTNEIEKYISQIVTASNEDFMDFKVEACECYIGEPIEYIRQYYTEKMAVSQIDFQIEKYDNCIVICDGDRVVEIMQNIIENAVKYGDGKSICMKFCHDEEAYYISVINTGCTLPDREIPHIFDSFFRGSNVGKNNGSGLGLYICRKLMHLMEGEIIAEKKLSGENEPESKMCVQIILRLVT